MSSTASSRWPGLSAASASSTTARCSRTQPRSVSECGLGVVSLQLECYPKVGTFSMQALQGFEVQPRYNIPPAPVPPKVGGFVGKEVENSEPSYMDPSIKQGPY